jgi:hypothetical protein
MKVLLYLNYAKYEANKLALLKKEYSFVVFCVRDGFSDFLQSCVNYYGADGKWPFIHRALNKEQWNN